MKHKHAELMAQYAQDAMETDKPWERWEWYHKGTEQWLEMPNNVLFSSKEKYRRKPTKKPFDLSVLIDSGIDCEFCDIDADNQWHRIGKLRVIGESSTPYWLYKIGNLSYCRPRMNHIHAIKLKDIGMEPMNIMQKFKDAGFVFESSITCQNDNKMFLLMWDFDKSPDHCYPWEIDNA